MLLFFFCALYNACAYSGSTLLNLSVLKKLPATAHIFDNFQKCAMPPEYLVV